jgi:hypothetical protein
MIQFCNFVRVNPAAHDLSEGGLIDTLSKVAPMDITVKIMSTTLIQSQGCIHRMKGHKEYGCNNSYINYVAILLLEVAVAANVILSCASYGHLCGDTDDAYQDISNWDLDQEIRVHTTSWSSTSIAGLQRLFVASLAKIISPGVDDYGALKHCQSSPK